MNELRVNGYISGKTMTSRVWNAAGQVYHVASEAFEAYGADGHAASSYAAAMTDKGGGAYRGDFPTAIVTEGDYFIEYWDAAITTQAVFTQDLHWSGSAEETMADMIDAVSSGSGGGSGDYEVVLTIRTTGGTALGGARVWLSTDNDRENIVAGALTTNDSGQATFNCDYATTYYVHCHLAGYRFAAANFTPAAGSVSFTKDIATSITAAGSASDYAASLLVRALAAVRKWADENVQNAKYSDDWIIERIENAYALVLGEINEQKQDPVVATISISFDGSTRYYTIPATMGPIVAIYHLDTEWGVKWFYRRGSAYNESGRGVWAMGNQINLQNIYQALGGTITVECIPNGCARLHCGTCTINADGDEITFGATPYLGTLDRAVNAYAGSMLRIFNVTGSTVTYNYIQERIIASYAQGTRVATLSAPLDYVPTTDDGYIFYEICPQIPVGLDSVLAMNVAWEINAVEQPKRAAGCLAMFNRNKRRLKLDAFMAQLQTAGQLDADTYQNSQYEGNLW